VPGLSPQGILFDLDNTLIDRSAALEGYLTGLARRFPDVFASEEARNAVRTSDQQGYRERGEFCRELVQRFPDLEMTPALFWADFAEGMAAAVEPRRAVCELVRDLLDRGLRLAVVTNGGSRRQRQKLARAGLEPLLPLILVSEEVGVEKPDPTIFRLALERLGLEADEVLFVGDDPVRDIAGAHGAGIATCWVSHGRPFPPGLPPPTVVVARVEALSLAPEGSSNR
jgi:putative hydrolase of the HAD superfamily